MIIPVIQLSNIFIISLNSHNIPHFIPKTNIGGRQGSYCPMLDTRHEPHCFQTRQTQLNGNQNPDISTLRTVLFLYSAVYHWGHMERHFKRPYLRDCYYNQSWLAADLPEAISSLLMLFHIKQVWEWVTLAGTNQQSDCFSSALKLEVLSLPGGNNWIQTSAIILQPFWGWLCFLLV